MALFLIKNCLFVNQHLFNTISVLDNLRRRHFTFLRVYLTFCERFCSLSINPFSKCTRKKGCLTRWRGGKELGDLNHRESTTRGALPCTLYSPACVAGVYLIKFLIRNLSYTPCIETSHKVLLLNGSPPPALIKFTPLDHSIYLIFLCLQPPHHLPERDSCTICCMHFSFKRS